jgi:photosynthetic reaction center cytochrome c subunit
VDIVRTCTVSIFVAAVSASTVAAQPPATAGATRPNLRVLQALPEAQLFPLMNLLADSLGVRCDYCHVQEKPDLTRTPANVGGWVWDRDDKPQKRLAREMMQMVVDLNARSFSGQTRVTCYTCHRGTTRPERLPVLPPPAGPRNTPEPPTLPTADRIWTNYVNAVGKVPTTKPGTGTVIVGWDDRSEGRWGKFEITLGDGERYRATLANPEGTRTQALDGDTAWGALNDRVVRFAPADVAAVRRTMLRYRAVKAEPPADLRVVGIDRSGDRDTYAVTGRIDALTTRTMYFDVVTGLLRRDVITTETLLLPIQEQVEYDDYRNADGVQMPFRIRISTDGAPYSTTIRTVSEIRRNVAVDETLFRLPPPPR